MVVSREENIIMSKRYGRRLGCWVPFWKAVVLETEVGFSDRAEMEESVQTEDRQERPPCSCTDQHPML